LFLVGLQDTTINPRHTYEVHGVMQRASFKEIVEFPDGEHAFMWEDAFNDYRDALVNFFDKCTEKE
jgi:pimeloyl-ACP methyl ester carboxylesterase